MKNLNFVIGIIVVIISFAIAAYIFVDKNTCYEKYSAGYSLGYTTIGGCKVDINGEMIPVNKIKN